jgi:hypothetical protein
LEYIITNLKQFLIKQQFYMSNTLKPFLIVKHNSPFDFSCYDILVKKGTKLPVNFQGSDIDSECGYQMQKCQYVKKALLENPEYEYLFSEDMGHIPAFNWIEKLVDNLVNENKATLIKAILIHNT